MKPLFFCSLIWVLVSCQHNKTFETSYKPIRFSGKSFLHKPQQYRNVYSEKLPNYKNNERQIRDQLMQLSPDDTLNVVGNRTSAVWIKHFFNTHEKYLLFGYIATDSTAFLELYESKIQSWQLKQRLMFRNNYQEMPDFSMLDLNGDSIHDILIPITEAARGDNTAFAIFLIKPKTKTLIGINQLHQDTIDVVQPHFDPYRKTLTFNYTHSTWNSKTYKWEGDFLKFVESQYCDATNKGLQRTTWAIKPNGVGKWVRTDFISDVELKSIPFDLQFEWNLMSNGGSWNKALMYLKTRI